MSQTTAERRWSLDLAEEYGHQDITAEVQALVSEANVSSGIVVVQLVGSTGGVTTIEYESGALADLRRTLDTIAPTAAHYDHNARWGDGNGFSHLRSALLKTSISIPIIGSRLALGTWQQIVVLNFDNRNRRREVVAVVMGS